MLILINCYAEALVIVREYQVAVLIDRFVCFRLFGFPGGLLSSLLVGVISPCQDFPYCIRCLLFIELESRLTVLERCTLLNHSVCPRVLVM